MKFELNFREGFIGVRKEGYVIIWLAIRQSLSYIIVGVIMTF
jgi:hypothetical protein